MALSLSLTCGMVLLKARVLAHCSLQSNALFDVIEKSVRRNLRVCGSILTYQWVITQRKQALQHSMI